MGAQVLNLLFSAAVVAIAIHIAGLALDHKTLSNYSKPWPVICWAIAAALFGPTDIYTCDVVLGLLCGAAGDVLLIKDETFIHGLVAFLVGHLFFIHAFWSGKERPPLKLMLLLPMTAYGHTVFVFMLPTVPSHMVLPVYVYSVVIAVMGWRAAARVGYPNESSFAQWMGAVGAAIFMISDTLVASGRFEHNFVGCRTLTMITYWMGQLGICMSCTRVPKVQKRE